MVKKMFWFSIVAVFLSLSVLTNNVGAAQNSKKPYTVLIYLNGSDLESENKAATYDLSEMMAIGSQKNVNVVIETGGAKKWHTKGISNKINQRWVIQKGKMKLVKSLNKRNMGDPNTLTDFLTWGMKTYPADRYAVVFWDHGGGSIYGFGADELFNNDSLTLPELEKAMKEAKKKTGKMIELVGFDACLMSTLETANLLNPYAKYLIASQELEPGHGWNYKTLLNAIVKNPRVTGDKLGKAIADGFMKQAKDYGTDDQITLSVTNLSNIPSLMEALNAFSKQATTNLGYSNNLITFGQARAKSREFSKTGMVDLADLAKNANSQSAQLSKNLENAIKQSISYQVTSAAYKDVKGLSIYFPINNKKSEELSYYKTLNFSKDYQGLLDRYYGINEDQKEITFDNDYQAEKPEMNENGDKIFEVKIAKEDIPRIAEIYSIIGMHDDDKFLYLGIDNDVNFDRNTGLISDNFTWSTITLEDSYISIFFDHETDDYARYTIPAILNGEYVELIVLYDYTKTDEDGFAYAKIIGAWPGIDDETGLASREIIKIEKGDKVTPLIYYYDFTKDDYDYIESDTIIVKKELDLYSTELPPGEYVYGFYAVDYFGNTAQSDFYDIVVE